MFRGQTRANAASSTNVPSEESEGKNESSLNFAGCSRGFSHVAVPGRLYWIEREERRRGRPGGMTGEVTG